MASLKTDALMKSPRSKNTNSKNRNNPSVAASFFIGDYLPTVESSDIPEILIPLEEIRGREINEFNDVPVDTLKMSIRQIGLINPITVIKEEGDEFYTISAGHRRFKAMSELHMEEPDNPSFQKIVARAYEITHDPELLAQGGRYITEEQEEQIYKDSNLQNRQLTYEDALKHIDYVISQVQKFAKNESLAISMLNKYREEEGKKIDRNKGLNKAEFISYILEKDLGYTGWKKENVRMYLVVKGAADDGDQRAIELLSQIKESDKSKRISIKKAHTLFLQEENTKKTRIGLVKKHITEIYTEIKDGRVLTKRETNQLQSLILDIEDILEMSEKNSENGADRS